MENPATWPRTERIISQVLDSFYENMRKPADERQAGWSLPKLIAEALRGEGLLLERGDQEEEGS